MSTKAQPNRAKLTKRSVGAMKAPNRGDRDVLLWDTEVRGFGVRVKPSGTRSYFVTYRNRYRRLKRLTLGQDGTLTPEQARALARAKLASVRAGEDPALERVEWRDAPTVGDLCDRYLREHAAERKKPSSRAHDEISIRLYVRPDLGSLKVAEVTRLDVERLHRRLKDRPYMANRVVALVSTMFNLAERWGWREGANPTLHVERWKEQPRERFLAQSEVVRLGEVLTAIEQEGRESPQAVLALRLLLLTGARKGEILGLRWRNVDFERQCLRLDDSKTGPKSIPLNAYALALLSEARNAAQSEWVVPGADPAKALVGLQKIWERVRERAELPDLRLHDLRHSFAAIGAGANLGWPIMQKLLGHRQVRTTARYAHLADDPLMQATEVIGGRIGSLLGLKSDGQADRPGEVVPIRAK